VVDIVDILQPIQMDRSICIDIDFKHYMVKSRESTVNRVTAILNMGLLGQRLILG